MPVLTAKQERRKKNARAFKLVRKLWARIKGNSPARDPDYLAWIRTQPCLLAENCHCCPFPILRVAEAAHTGPHGISQKASDHDAIPLCAWMHQQAKDAQGKSRDWFTEHGLDRAKIIAGLRAKYEQERAV